MDPSSPIPTRFHKRPPEKGHVSPITLSEAKRTLGYELCDWVYIVDRKLEPFRYYGLRKRSFDGTPLAILTFRAASEYIDPLLRYLNGGPTFHVFQIRLEVFSEKERVETANRILKDVLAQCRRREKLPATAKFKRSCVLYTFAAELQVSALEGR